MKGKTTNLICNLEQWHEFVRIQRSGQYNMLDPNARLMSSLDKSEWLNILKYYEDYEEVYGQPKGFAR